MDKRLLLLVIILTSLIIILIINMGIFSFIKNKKTKTFLNYQKVTLQQIEQEKDKLNGKKVEYTGECELAFEISLLDRKIWIEPSVDYVTGEGLPNFHNGSYHAKIRVFGTLLAEKGAHYGHLGMELYQINADKIELLERLPIIPQE